MPYRLFVKCGGAVEHWTDIAAWCATLEDSGILRWLIANDSLDVQYETGPAAKSMRPKGADTINLIQSNRGFTQFGERLMMLDALVSTRYADATNPKDKVYGLLGIAKAEIFPKYSQEVAVQDVYHEACLLFVMAQTFEMLSCVDHDEPCRPSWVPDWSSPRVTQALGFSTKAWTLYQAGGISVHGAGLSKTKLSEDKKELSLSGKHFDSIVAIGTMCENAIIDIENLQLNRELWISYIKLACDSSPTNQYPGHGISIFDAFWQTLVAGRDGTGIAAPTKDHEEVVSLLLDSVTGRKPSLPGQSYSIRHQKGFFNMNNLRSRKPAKVLADLMVAYRAAMQMRKFAVTRKGYFGLVPRGTREGDEVVIFEKACVPFVVRKADGPLDQAKYELLGEAYVHGIMHAEAMRRKDIALEVITIV